MKIRLSTKYFRVRVAIWICSFGALVFLLSGIKVLNGSIKEKSLSEILIEDKVLFLFTLSSIFSLIAVVGILTYIENHFNFDRKKWNQKGFKPKLEVLGDWIIK
ncbi:hypothetical protein [Adhaeribacter rhizoryzae]|uniref:Uncharacterized protein n=1 Tax=Adhaeribacter rhizoryzae TaxID=2607907 RepID=A0A5M6CW17_9BACT|nr:hypothetical protein [Adhaeribacter rhizoryzae]KAA5538570.1 hypothetical protein F0145_25910 [Adhaeribacter rhizoryzae]